VNLTQIKQKIFGVRWTDDNGFTWRKRPKYWEVQYGGHTNGKTFAGYCSVKEFNESQMNDLTKAWT
jgi:hypothetical protein